MLAESYIPGTISKYQNGTPKVPRKAFNIGEVWNPVEPEPERSKRPKHQRSGERREKDHPQAPEIN